MGSTELAANLFRATQAEDKLRRENIEDKFKANHTHYEVGTVVRETIEKLGGTMPDWFYSSMSRILSCCDFFTAEPQSTLRKRREREWNRINRIICTDRVKDKKDVEVFLARLSGCRR